MIDVPCVLPGAAESQQFGRLVLDRDACITAHPSLTRLPPPP